MVSDFQTRDFNVNILRRIKNLWNWKFSNNSGILLTQNQNLDLDCKIWNTTL